jgi:AcrR family transcriptional regulator
MGKNKRDKLTEFNRSIILEAAKTLFEADGAGQTTMDDIAKQADMSKSTIYVYFRSKDEIYYSLIFESMLLLKEKLDAAVKN